VSTRILTGDCLEVLRSLPACFRVNCVVTSPPYYGLRDYGTATWEGGDAGCDHKGAPLASSKSTLAGYTSEEVKLRTFSTPFRDICGKCGARRVDNQIGLEETPEAYVAKMVEVFREVRRVLADDGTLWLNIGDSYTSGNRSDYGPLNPDDKQASQAGIKSAKRAPTPQGMKPKDLIGIPWMLATALRDPYYAGKIKRVEDRIWLAAIIDGEGCMFIHKRKAGSDSGAKWTKADGTEVSYSRTQDTYGAGLEVANTSPAIIERCIQITGVGSVVTQNKDRRQTLYRWNVRSNECRWVVQEVYPHLVAKQHQARVMLGCPSSGPKAEAGHAALIDLHNGKPTDVDFPAPASLFEPGWYLRQDIIWAKSNPMPESVRDRCTKSHEYVFLLAKSSRYFYDADAVREDVKETSGIIEGVPLRGSHVMTEGGRKTERRVYDEIKGANRRSVWTITTQPFSEAHFATMAPELAETCIKAGSRPGDTILDPFGGAGTTALCADRLGRNALLIELNPAYVEIARKRLTNDAGLFAEVAA
jgi:DNA modification methylase